MDISYRVSKVLMTWLNNPMVNMKLGGDVLMELKATTGLDVHVGMSYATAAIGMGVMHHKARRSKKSSL